MCVLVEVDGGAGERPRASPGCRRFRPDELQSELRALTEAGVDEVILVLDPINERSIRLLEQCFPALEQRLEVLARRPVRREERESDQSAASFCSSSATRSSARATSRLDELERDGFAFAGRGGALRASASARREAAGGSGSCART